MRWTGIFMAAAFAAGLANAAARADVIFNLVQVDRTTVGFTGSIVITDEAYASGYDLLLRKPSSFMGNDSRTVRSGLEALRGIYFDFTPSFPEVFDAREFGQLGLFRTALIQLSAAPSSLPSGRIEFYDSETQFSYTLSGNTGAGEFLADYYYRSCYDARPSVLYAYVNSAR